MKTTFKKQHYFLVFLGLFIFNFTNIQAQVAFDIELLPDCTYQVFLVPEVTWESSQKITATAQVTIVSSTGTLEIGDLQSINGTWSNNSNISAPVENPTMDYHTIGLTSLGTMDISYTAGVPEPLFTFSNTGNCSGEDITLISNNDPFLPPNSENANVGNKITTLGSGNVNAWNEAPASFIPCVGNGVSDCDDGLGNAELDLKVLLEGSYLGDGQMHTYLNNNSLLPLQHPYENAPYDMPANSAINSLPSDMVDWVIVELRSDENPVVKTVGVLLADGAIKDLNGVDNLNVELVEEDSYSIIVRHRNHLDVISATSIDYAAVLSYDFTLNKSQALDGKQAELLDGYAAMYTGDGTQDLIIQLTDFDLWKTNPAQINAYGLEDFIMDGIIQVTDYDAWVKNKAILGPPQLAY